MPENIKQIVRLYPEDSPAYADIFQKNGIEIGDTFLLFRIVEGVAESGTLYTRTSESGLSGKTLKGQEFTDYTIRYRV